MLVFVLVGVTAGPVHAQTTAGRLEIAIGGGWVSRAGLGERDANLRANADEPRDFRLFAVDSELSSSLFADARVGWSLSDRFAVEGRVSVGRPELAASVSADAEGAPPLTIVERIDQYAFEGGVLVNVETLRLAGWRPFVAGGAGYLRELHEGHTLIEEGHVVYAGVGLKRRLVSRVRGTLKAAGVRVEARVQLLGAGLSLDSGPRLQAAVSGAFFVAF